MYELHVVRQKTIVTHEKQIILLKRRFKKNKIKHVGENRTSRSHPNQENTHKRGMGNEHNSI